MSKWLQKLGAVAFGLSAAGVAAAPYYIEYSGVIDTVDEVVPNNPDQYATNPELPAAGEAFRLVLVLDNDGASDAQERLNGTDPLDAASVVVTRAPKPEGLLLRAFESEAAVNRPGYEAIENGVSATVWVDPAD